VKDKQLQQLSGGSVKGGLSTTTSKPDDKTGALTQYIQFTHLHVLLKNLVARRLGHSCSLLKLNFECKPLIKGTRDKDLITLARTIEHLLRANQKMSLAGAFAEISKFISRDQMKDMKRELYEKGLEAIKSRLGQTEALINQRQVRTTVTAFEQIARFVLMEKYKNKSTSDLKKHSNTRRTLGLKMLALIVEKKERKLRTAASSMLKRKAVKSLQATLEQILGKSKAFESRLDDESRKVEQIEQASAALKEENSSLKSQIIGLNGEIQKSMVRSKFLDEENKKLISKLNSSETKNRETIQALEDALGRVKDEMHYLAKQRESQESSEVSELRNQIRDKEKQFGEQNKQKDKETREKLKEIEKELLLMKHAISERDDVILGLKDDLRRTEDRRAEIFEANGKLQREAESMKIEMNQLSSELEKERQNCESLTKNLEKELEESECLKENGKALEARLVKLNKEKPELERELASKQNQLSKQEEFMRQLVEKYQQLEQERNEEKKVLVRFGNFCVKLRAGEEKFGGHNSEARDSGKGVGPAKGVAPGEAQDYL
jgi:chromosome segregation ATPase